LSRKFVSHNTLGLGGEISTAPIPLLDMECNTFFSTYPDVDEVPHAHGGGNARLYGHSVEEVILNAKTSVPRGYVAPQSTTIKIGA